MHNLSDPQIRTELKKLVSKGRVVWTAHAEERMELRGIDKGMVKECLSKGFFEGRPYLSNKSADINYEFKIVAIVDGEPLAVVAALYPDSHVAVITCM